MADKLDHQALDPRFIAGVNLLERCGARQVRVGYSDADEGPPIIWHATALLGSSHGRPVFDVAAGRDPVQAVLRLCASMTDGGECLHCHKPTMFDETVPIGTVIDQIADAAFCVYAWDPELATFRRGCE